MLVGALPETFALDDRPVCWLSLGSTIYLGPPLDLSGHARMVGALILGISGPLTITADYQSVHARSVFIPAQCRKWCGPRREQRCARRRQRQIG